MSIPRQGPKGKVYRWFTNEREARAFVCGRWGSTPNPGRGHRPLHPFIGASPQGIMCLVCYPCFDIAFPFGAAPQAPREPLGAEHFSVGSEASEKGRWPPRLHGFFDKLKGRGTHAAVPPFAAHPFLVPSQAPRVGFWGVAPNGYATPKQNGDTSYNPLGAKPQIWGAGDKSPAGAWGGAPHHTPPIDFVDSLRPPPNQSQTA